jgi:excisionase family DNA binding protein
MTARSRHVESSSASLFENPQHALSRDRGAQPRVASVLWTVDDVAQFLRVSARTVQDWVYRKKIPFRKAGKALRFAPQEIEQWTLAHQKGVIHGY